MSIPRVTIGRLMLGIALPCIPLALVLAATRRQSLISGDEFYDLGLWPGLAAFLAASIALAERRGVRSPFLWGFATVGWMSVLAYLACCFRMQWILDRPIVYYFNGIDFDPLTWLIDADRLELYAVNLLVLGLFLAMPQLIMATLGGLIARRIWGVRWTTT
jgi:hypothetical protein